MALAGGLTDLGFAEIVQALNQGRKTGELTVRRPSEEARVYFTSGEIVQATLKALAPADPVHGAEVVYRLLGWQEGEFIFERSQRGRARIITETTDELILEGMKRLDEWERVTEEITDLNVVLRSRANKVSDHYDDFSTDAKVILRLIDARRDVSTIIRESGFDPQRALRAVSELFTLEAVEKWDPSAQPLGYGAM